MWLQARPQEFRFDHLSVNDGLSQAAVRAIAEDSLGFIWFGTRDGLNKYDGREFTVFKNNGCDSSCISSNSINALLVDPKGKLWVGTSRGLNLYYPESSTFSTFLPKDPISGKAYYSINCLSYINEDAIWVGADKNLLMFNPTDNTFTELHGISGIIKDIVRIDQWVWVATDNGLYRFNLPGTSVKKYNKESLDPFIETLFKDSGGTLWIGTEESLYKYIPETDSFNLIKKSNSTIYSIVGYQDHILYSIEDELIDLDPRNGNTIIYTTNSGSKNGISHTIITFVKDNGGILWAGTNGGGVDYYDPNKNYFQLYRKSENGEGLPDNYVSSFEEVDSGKILIGTKSGLCIFNPNTLKYEYFNPGESKYMAHVRALLVEGNNLWIGSLTGFSQYNLMTGRYKNWEVGNGSNEIGNGQVVSIIKARDGKIWIGTLKGLNVYDPFTNTFDKDISPEENSDFLHKQINSLMEDKDGNIWIGTPNGLTLMDSKSRKFTLFQNNEQDASSLSKNYVMSSFQDSEGEIWISTWGGGFNKVINNGESFLRFGTNQGLPDDVVYGFLEDKEGYLWLSTNKGLVRFNPVNYTFKTYTVEEGLQNNEFNTGAFFKSRNGTMYFGGISGATSINPDDIRINNSMPNTIITDFVSLNHSGPNSTTLKEELHKGLISLKYNQNSFEAKFISLNFTHSFKNQYRIRLYPFEEEWRDIGTTNFTVYTNIPPGIYNFQVMGSNNDLVWDSSPAEITLVIAPPFYATFWFRSLIILLTACIVLAVYKFRLRFYKQAKIKLENEVKLRTAEVNEQKEELEKKSKIIEKVNDKLTLQAKELQQINNTLEEKVLLRTRQIQESHSQVSAKNEALKKANEELDLFVYSVSHQLRAPLVSVLGLINVAKLENPEMSQKCYLDLIKKSVKRLDESIREINDHARNIRLDISRDPVDFNKILEDILSSMEYLESTNLIRIEKRIIEDYEFKTDELRLKIILSNLISNALKYYYPSRPKPVVKININIDEVGSTICVYDNGIGIPASELENIFRIFYRASEHGYGSGLGLYIVKEIIQKLGGSIEVESKEGEYSRFTVKIPHYENARQKKDFRHDEMSKVSRPEDTIEKYQ